ncbi:MAG TPA: GatB/YqeY domain-containing protein [Planctomycetota bacterium]|nr:GatB/YqeY domain-containing protein [Planctomycetota bacterium]
MNLNERLQHDLKEAMRSGDTLRRDTLRMALAAAKNRRIELMRDLVDEDVVGVLQRSVRSRHEAATEYGKAGREDLADKERAEAVVLQGYLPQVLSEDETRAIVRGLIAEHGIAGKADLGRLMKLVMAEHKGRVDGKLVNRIAAELLG